MARGELHVQLSVDYADNPKMIAAGEKAELLYVRALCLAKRTMSNGDVYANQLSRFGLSGAQARARQLVAVGLWEERPDGYYITGYLERNKSKDEILRDRRKDANRKAGFREESGGNPDGLREPETESQSEEQSQSKSEASAEAGFQQFWDAYPTNKGGRAGALGCWKARRREGIEADDMVIAAVNYSDHCRDKETDEEFIMQGKTFLGPNLRYEEYLHRPAYVPAPAIESNGHVTPPEVHRCPVCTNLEVDCVCGATIHEFTKASSA